LLADDVVERLLGQVRPIIDEVVQDRTLGERVKVALLQRLRAVEEALLSVRITGTVAVEQAAEGLVGHVVVPTRPEREHPLMKKALRLGGAVLMAAASATGAMIPELAAGTGDGAQPPAIVIEQQVIEPAPLVVLQGVDEDGPPAIESSSGG
jgi:hypothetical protein